VSLSLQTNITATKQTPPR